MKTNVVTTDPVTGNLMINKEVLNALRVNGTYLPNVKRVVFNLKTTEEVPARDDNGNVKTEPATDRHGDAVLGADGKPVMKTVYEQQRLDAPVLVTKVWWSDNTTTTVRNSKHDAITTEMKELEDGSRVEVATESSKTIGIMAAVTKRTCGVPDDNGEIVDTNVGKILTDIVNSGYDQQLEVAKSKLQRAKSKERAKKISETTKQKNNKKRYSYADCLQLAGPILEAISKNPAVIDRIMKAVTDVSEA